MLTSLSRAMSSYTTLGNVLNLSWAFLCKMGQENLFCGVTEKKKRKTEVLINRPNEMLNKLMQSNAVSRDVCPVQIQVRRETPGNSAPVLVLNHITPG